MIHRSTGATIALCVLSFARLGGCFTFTPGSAQPDAWSSGRQSRHTTAVHSTRAAKDEVACVEEVDVRRRTRSDEMEKVTAERVSAWGGMPGIQLCHQSSIQVLSTYALRVCPERQSDRLTHAFHMLTCSRFFFRLCIPVCGVTYVRSMSCGSRFSFT